MRMWVLCHYKRKEESPECVAAQSGDSFFVHMDVLLHFGHLHYIICRFELQDT